MTTAHRPTFDPAVGKTSRGPAASHTRSLPAHTHLKMRKAGQGGDADQDVYRRRDLRAELLAAEAAHFAKVSGRVQGSGIGAENATSVGASKRLLESGDGENEVEENMEAKRRRILEESRAIDADSNDEGGGGGGGSGSDDSSTSDSDSEDETAELQRELEKIKRERAARAAAEREAAEAEANEARAGDIARGNPLLNGNAGGSMDFTTRRRWDDDVVFRNQARGTDDRAKGKEFVNDSLRSDFHKRFMAKYVR